MIRWKHWEEEVLSWPFHPFFDLKNLEFQFKIHLIHLMFFFNVEKGLDH